MLRTTALDPLHGPLEVHVPSVKNLCSNVKLILQQIGQRHGGFIGFMQSILNKASHHIWFERGENRDRMIVIQR